SECQRQLHFNLITSASLLPCPFDAMLTYITRNALAELVVIGDRGVNSDQARRAGSEQKVLYLAIFVVHPQQKVIALGRRFKARVVIENLWVFNVNKQVQIAIVARCLQLYAKRWCSPAQPVKFAMPPLIVIAVDDGRGRKGVRINLILGIHLGSGLL